MKGDWIGAPHLGLWSLEERRNRADLLQVFRMYKGWSVISFDSMFTFSDNTRMRGHSAKIVKNRCRLDVRRHFFCKRVIDRWNSLDQCIIDSTTVNAFRNGLEKQEMHRSGSLRTDGPPFAKPNASPTPDSLVRCGRTWYVPGM